MKISDGFFACALIFVFFIGILLGNIIGRGLGIEKVCNQAIILEVSKKIPACNDYQLKIMQTPD